MEPILVDTSVWIDWFGKKSRVTSQTERLGVYLGQKMPVYITAVILQKVLQGVREDTEYEKVREVLLDLSMLLLDPVEAAIGAAELYRMLRKKGVTIRKPNDCLIAQYAIFYDIPILHSDVDFDQIARHSPLRIAAV
jgi:hypothetical protein